MNINHTNTENKHLKIINDSIHQIVLKILTDILSTKKTVKVLNIGGGYKKEMERFLSSNPKVEYYCLDTDTSRLDSSKNNITGDITDPELFIGHTFDFIYTCNTFEHILNPWDSATNIKRLLNEGGYFVCITPFSWRYHACPVDTFRYSHTGLRYLFERLDHIEHIFSGYKRFSSSGGWYKSKTDVTLDGKLFKENIETMYVGKKNSEHIFDINQLDVDNQPH